MRRTWIVAALILFTQVASGQPAVTQTSWGKDANGSAVELFTITAPNIEVKLATYGARIVSICVPNRMGQMSAEENFLRLLPGESFEATQRVKFGVVSHHASHPPDTLRPGKYFLKLTETTWWEIDGQDQSLKEKWGKPGVLMGLALRSELMSFVVKGKPTKRRA